MVRRRAAFFLALVALAAGVWTMGWQQAHRARVAEARAAEVGAERTAVLAKIGRKPDSGQQRTPAPRRTVTEVTKAARMAPDAWKTLTRNFYAADYRLSYHSFFRRAALGSAKESQLAERYADYQWTYLQLQARLQPMKPDDPARQDAQAGIKAAYQSYQDDVKAMLGPVDFASLQAFTRTIMLQSVPGELAVMLAGVDTPLSASQGDALTDSLVRHATDPTGKVNPRNVDWQGVIQEASTMLTPDQLQYLKLLANAREASAALNRVQAQRR